MGIFKLAMRSMQVGGELKVEGGPLGGNHPFIGGLCGLATGGSFRCAFGLGSFCLLVCLLDTTPSDCCSCCLHLGPLVTSIFNRCCRIIFLLGLIQIPARDFHHSAKGLGALSNSTLSVSAVRTVPGASSEGKIRAGCLFPDKVSWVAVW